MSRLVRCVSWNVNGLRAAAGKGFYDWLPRTEADFILLQEVRALKEQLDPAWLEHSGYKSEWFPALKKGYSGVAIYYKPEWTPKAVHFGFEKDEFDSEGRVVGLEFEKFVVVSAYFPNSQRGGGRVDYKIAFCQHLAQWLQKFQDKNKHVIIGGDLNISHKEIDLANPKQNEKNAGFLPEERGWLTYFVDKLGYIDTFREFEKGGGHYTWWKNGFGIRERNIGWRLDYHFVSSSLKSHLVGARIHADVMGSDHCPVSLEFELK